MHFLLAMWVWVSTTIISIMGSVDVDKNTQYQLVEHKKDMPLRIQVEGKDAGGDVDCYLQAHNLSVHGWVIVAKDERFTNSCDLQYLPPTDQPLRLWIANHGAHATRYVLSISQ